jgi:hypothetical protein
MNGFGSGFVDTGVIDSAMMASSILWVRESTFNVLKGPITSVVSELAFDATIHQSWYD